MPEPIENNHPFSGRCHYCGYSLKGLEIQGNCPECGTEYTEESALRLKPWPGKFETCMRLWFPLWIYILICIFAIGGYVTTLPGGFTIVEVILILSVVPIYVYFQEWSMHKEHLPEQKRKQVSTPVLLAIRTVIVAVVTLLFVACVLFIVRWFID